ncbi:MAG: hypothetical protein NXI29_10605 [bacterium]|nr:hypothetical protein [bacterium]
MKSPVFRIRPTEWNKLEKLPHGSISVYSIRNFLRVQPLLANNRNPTAIYKEAVVNLHNQVEILKYHSTTKQVLSAVEKFASIAYDETNEEEKDYSYAAYVAYHISIYAFSSSYAAFYAGRAVFNTSFVAHNKTMSNPTSVDKAQDDEDYVVATAGVDYRILRSLDEVIFASEKGPVGDLWHGNPPDWYIKSKAHYDKTIKMWGQEI